MQDLITPPTLKTNPGNKNLQFQSHIRNVGIFCALPIIMMLLLAYNQKKKMLLNRYWRSLIIPFWERIRMATTKAITSLGAELLKPSIGGIIPLFYTSQILTYWSNCPPYAEILSTISLKDANPATAWYFQPIPQLNRLLMAVRLLVTFHLLALVLTAEATSQTHALFYWTVIHICEDSNIV